MMWNWHGNGWWWFVMMPAVMVAFSGLVAWLVVTVIRSSQSGETRPPVSEDPQRILDTRYARDEIDADEYHRRSDDLRATSRAG